MKSRMANRWLPDYLGKGRRVKRLCAALETSQSSSRNAEEAQTKRASPKYAKAGGHAHYT